MGEEELKEQRATMFITIMNMMLYAGYKVGWDKWKFRNLSHNEGRQVTAWIILPSGKILSQDLFYSNLLPRNMELIKPLNSSNSSFIECMEEINQIFKK